MVLGPMIRFAPKLDGNTLLLNFTCVGVDALSTYNVNKVHFDMLSANR